ncbi:MAG: carboxypeptidase regulatory-like domain-containing protein [Acidobacteria bacterium]|nr:carboxypeptidase regulatory-like domain-containing protein [Acidobacteriota bacterium]
MKMSCSLLVLALLAGLAQGQTSATLTGGITDPTGAPVQGGEVRATNLETGATASAATDGRGRYRFLALPVGAYKLRVEKPGFREILRSGIILSVGQESVVDFQLQVGAAAEQIDVNEGAALVALTSQGSGGLVGERSVKELPLNGRSYDLLLPLNPGVVNFTSQKTGGLGVSNSTTGNNFAVSGNRPQQNLFLLNGIEYTGAAENNMQPGGPSQELLGVEAVREFNVLRDGYGAEYGKHPGAQVVIATQAGSLEWHGAAFEFLRNSALDSRNYFDQGAIPHFQRNQFGASAGGPLKLPSSPAGRDRTFLFVNFEGLRQQLNQTSAAFVPDLASRAAAAPSVQPYLQLWPAPPAGAPDFNGIAEVFSSPRQAIREDFGTARLDHILGTHDSLAAVYTVDDGADTTATVLDPFSTDILTLREQVLSLEESHTFSPLALNVARAGFSRAGYFYTGEPTPGTPATSVPGFLAGKRVGAVVVGGSAASNPQAQLGLAGSNNGSNLRVARNLFTFEDRFTVVRGRHQYSVGVWLQPFQSNENIALSQYGQATFSSLQAFLQGTVTTFLYDPAPTPMNWRSLFSAWYAQDTIQAGPRVSITAGFRAESSTGWNEAHGRAATYLFPGGVISSQPHLGGSAFSENRSKFLPQPRIGIAWSPWGTKTVVHAGFGMYNDLQDALGYRADQNAPFNPTYSLASVPLSQLPINPAAPVPAAAKLVPGGVQPDLHSPTLLSWSLGIEQQLSPSSALRLRYVGSHGYHEILGLDANEPVPVICPAAPCPASFPANFPGALANAPVPAGTFYIAPGTAKANPALANTWTWFSLGTSSYNALQAEFDRRFSGGLSLRSAYTWSKTLDDGDSLNATTAGNAPGLVANPFNLRADWGPATYDVRQALTVSGTYELPFGRGAQHGWRGKAWSGWSISSIFQAQAGFPFTPQLSYNPSNNGDTRNPVRPFLSPAFAGPVVTGSPNQWFSPQAFLAPPPNSGFYGNAGRNQFTGPGLATWDVSGVKRLQLRERFAAQFRVEVFNLLNRANFGTPNLIVFTPSGISGTAGAITGTSTSARQMQLGLKLLW